MIKIQHENSNPVNICPSIVINLLPPKINLPGSRL